MASLLLLLTGAVCAQATAPVFVIGDSWGTYGATPFKEMFSSRNVTVDITNQAVGGTTAAQWATGQYLNPFISAIPSSGEAYVWITLGGNDVMDDLGNCINGGTSVDGCIAKVLAEVTKNLDTIVSAMWKKNKDISVLQFGYDILNFGSDLAFWCPIAAGSVLPACNDDPYCINSNFTKIQAGIEAEGAKWTKNGYSYNTINILGTMQAAENVGSASPGHPDLSQWSPADEMLSNCIHPNPTGFKAVMDQVWGMFFSKHFS